MKPNPNYKDQIFEGPLENVSSPPCGRDKKFAEKEDPDVRLPLPFFRNTTRDRGESLGE